MIFMKVTFCAVLVCFVPTEGADVYLPVGDEMYNLDLKLAARMNSSTEVVDNFRHPLAEVLLSLSVWGDYNHTSDQQIISALVHNKLQSLQEDEQNSISVEENLLVEERKGLPLTLNHTVTEVKIVGPAPFRTLAMQLKVLVYARDHHRQALISSLEAFI